MTCDLVLSPHFKLWKATPAMFLNVCNIHCGAAAAPPRQAVGAQPDPCAAPVGCSLHGVPLGAARTDGALRPARGYSRGLTLVVNPGGVNRGRPPSQACGAAIMIPNRA